MSIYNLKSTSTNNTNMKGGIAMINSTVNNSNVNMKGGVNMTNTIIRNGNGTCTFEGTVYESYAKALLAKQDALRNVDPISALSVKSHIMNNEYQPDMFAKVISFQVKGENGETRTVIVDKVGMITKAGAAVDAAFLSGNFDTLLKVVSSILKIKDKDLGKHKGVRYIAVKTEMIEMDGIRVAKKTLSKRGLKDICANMKNCDLNNKLNLSKVALDLNRILRVYQETCIDAAKTGETISLDMLAREHRDLASQLIDVVYEDVTWDVLDADGNNVLDANGKKVTISYENTPMLKRIAPEKTNFDFIESGFSNPQEAWKDRVNMDFAPIHADDIIMSAETFRDLGAVLKSKSYPIDVIYNTKVMYNKLAAQYHEAKEKEEAGDRDTDSTMASDAFKIGCDMLAQKVRKTLANYTNDEKVLIVMAVALSGGMSDRKIDINKSNKFLLNTIKEEYEIYINGGSNIVITTGYAISDNRGLNAGDICWFNNGICVDTNSFISCGKKLYTGIATIEERNGKLCAMVPTVINVPSYNEDEEIVMFNADEKLDIKIGDAIGVGNKRHVGGRVIVNVYINDNRVGDLYYSFKNESVLENIRGAVMSYVCAKNKKETYGKYTYTVKLNKEITKEEIKEIVTSEVSNNYFEEDEIMIGDIFFDNCDSFQYDLRACMQVPVEVKETEEESLVVNTITIEDEEDTIPEDEIDDYLDAMLDNEDTYEYNLKSNN